MDFFVALLHFGTNNEFILLVYLNFLSFVGEIIKNRSLNLRIL